jgi:ferric-dicitrate binding protein FerR (iron transport regulator)
MNERELIQAYLDDDPAAREAVEGDADLLRLALEHRRLEAALRVLHESELARERRVLAIVADVQGERVERAVTRVQESLRPRRVRWWSLALAASVALLTGLGLWRLSVPERVAVSTGDVLVLRAGETGRYRMADGSTFDLAGPADLIVGRTLRLREGRITVAAAKRPPGDPLVVLGPHARSEVLGTKFVMDATPRGTRLDVREGRVRFVPNGAAAQLVGGGGGAEGRTEARDPVHQPFASDSPWNTALGGDARLEAITSLVLARGVHVETREWAIPIYVAAPADPVRQLFFRSNGERAGAVRVDPATPEFDGNNNTYLALVDERLERVWELSGPQRDPAGAYRGGDIGVSDLAGPGWGTAGPSHSGASLLGGLIRRGELMRGVPHALAVLVPASAINREGQPFEWPATHALSSWHRYGTNGHLRLGSLLALPPDADLSALNGPALLLAEALRDYGAYVVGTFNAGGQDLVLLADRACDPEVTPELMDQLRPVVAGLQRVANNTAATPGGGGVRRRLAAPPVVRLE